jgi:hypothetical protein
MGAPTARSNARSNAENSLPEHIVRLPVAESYINICFERGNEGGMGKMYI